MTSITNNTKHVRGFLRHIEAELRKPDPNLKYIRDRVAHANDAVNTIDAQLEVVAEVFACQGTCRSKHYNVPPTEVTREQRNEVRRVVELETIDELTEYLRELQGRNAAPYPVIFADYNAVTFTLYPCYHAAKLSWLDHAVSVTLTFSREYLAWQGKAGVRMSQTDFAEFIDSNGRDLKEPAVAEMLTMATAMESARTEVFRSAIRVKIAVRIFHGDKATVEVDAKLYYRINDGAGVFYYTLHRAGEVVEKVWAEKFLSLRDDVTLDAHVFAGTQSSTPPV